MAAVRGPEPSRSAAAGGSGDVSVSGGVGAEGSGGVGGVRLVVLLGGNTLLGVGAALGWFSIAAGVVIGLGLLLLVWLFDVSVAVSSARYSS
jgi:hypothetical protein